MSVAAPSPNDGWRSWLRRRVARREDWRRYGLRLDDGWRDAHAVSPVVVVLHGFNSTPESTEGLIDLARQAGLPCGVFAYPNDQPLRLSAELLSRELRGFASKHPQRRVALVTHSMGGLVARECIEDDRLYPGVVDRLIMVSPPTHGSMLARYAVGLDLWEHWLNRRTGGPWQRTRDAIVDGLSEAPADLRPGSEFLTQLNARRRREGVRYTLLLGSDAQLSKSQHYMLRRSLCSLAENAPGCDADTEAIDRLIAKMDEVIDGRGDGAVAVSRGRLSGVVDTHVLPFSHLSVISSSDEDSVRRAHQLILDRLLSDRGA